MRTMEENEMLRMQSKTFKCKRCGKKAEKARSNPCFCIKCKKQFKICKSCYKYKFFVCGNCNSKEEV